MPKKVSLNVTDADLERMEKLMAKHGITKRADYLRSCLGKAATMDKMRDEQGFVTFVSPDGSVMKVDLELY